MKKIAIFSMTFILLLASIGNAFWRKTRHHDPYYTRNYESCYFVDIMTEDLDLNEEQREKLIIIMDNGWAKMQEEKEKFYRQMESLRREKDDEIMKILNEDQKIKFQKKLNDPFITRRGVGRGIGGGRGRGPGRGIGRGIN